MSVCGEENGKEVNSKCGKTASSLIVRHTILGGIGVIQQLSAVVIYPQDDPSPLQLHSSVGHLSVQIAWPMLVVPSLLSWLLCCLMFISSCASTLKLWSPFWGKNQMGVRQTLKLTSRLLVSGPCFATAWNDATASNMGWCSHRRQPKREATPNRWPAVVDACYVSLDWAHHRNTPHNSRYS